MADPRGFLKVRDRQTQPRRPVPVRIMDWKEVYEAQEKGVLRSQAGRCMEPFDGLPALAPPGEVVPLRNEVAERAALVAERHAAVHAAAGLASELGGVTLLVHLFPVHEPHRNRAAGGQFAIRGLQESLGVSHRSPPSLE